MHGQTPEQAMRERMRAGVINQLGRVHGRRDLADGAILRGTPIQSFERELLEQISEPLRPLGAIGMTSREIAQFSLMRWLNTASRDPEQAGHTFEGECHRAVCAAIGRSDDAEPGRLLLPLEILQRDLHVATPGAGGYLVNARENVSFSDALRSLSIVQASGATILAGLQGNSHVPRVSASATAEWLTDELDAPTESQPTLEDVPLLPKTVAAYCEMSRNVARQPSPAVEGVVFRDLAAILGKAIDVAAVNGSGADGQPRGILNTASIPTFPGTTLGLAGLIEAQTDVANSNGVVDATALAYVTTPSVAGVLMQRHRVASTNSPLWQGAVHSGMVEGVQARSTTAMPSATAIYADWSSLLIGQWSVLEISTNPYAGFAAGIVGARAFWTIDIGVRHLASFTVASAIT